MGNKNLIKAFCDIVEYLEKKKEAGSSRRN